MDGLFITENPINPWMIWGVPLFLETPTFVHFAFSWSVGIPFRQLAECQSYAEAQENLRLREELGLDLVPGGGRIVGWPSIYKSGAPKSSYK